MGSHGPHHRGPGSSERDGGTRAAIAAAIQTWADTLDECFDGLITLEDVTGGKRRDADIVVHYVPTAGGVVFGGYAICGDYGCPNILVRSDLPPSLDRGADLSHAAELYVAAADQKPSKGERDGT